MKRIQMDLVALSFAVRRMRRANKPVVLRFVSDFTGRRTRQGSR